MAPKGGTIEAANAAIKVSGADEAVLLIAAATSYRRYDDVSGDPEALTKQTLDAASRKKFNTLRQAHVAEHQRLFRRVKLDLGTTDAARLPTDERAKISPAADLQLAALYFQYGRYLLISSSRPGTQPANLQGIWNESMAPPWDSKYTININTQMNYWLAEPTNLGECVEPLVRMIMELTETGARTARVQYGARGWVAHHNTDLWRATAPIDGPQWGMCGGRGLALSAPLGALRVYGRQRVSGPRLPGDEGRRAVLPRHPGRRAETPLARHQPIALARKSTPVRDQRRCGADDGQPDSS